MTAIATSPPPTRRALTDRARAAEARAKAAEAALVSLTCDGSEFYTRDGDGFRVDVPACLAYVATVREGWQATIKAALASKRETQARLAQLEEALAVCRQTIKEQAVARLDPSMPLLATEVLEELRALAEVHYAMAETRDERVSAHGLSLLCEWQDAARVARAPAIAESAKGSGEPDMLKIITDAMYELGRRTDRVLAWRIRDDLQATLSRRTGSKVQQGCINHPDRPVRTNLDGDDLCQECADAWARAEGDWQQELDAAPPSEGRG